MSKTALVTQIQGITFAGKADTGHWVPMDGPVEFGGSAAATRPKELVLIGLGGCTASDVVNILAKKRVAVDNVSVNLTAEEADEHPKRYTTIHMEYIVTGRGIRREDVERAIELSETKYCSVSAMLKPTVTISHSYRIVDMTPVETTA